MFGTGFARYLLGFVEVKIATWPSGGVQGWPSPVMRKSNLPMFVSCSNRTVFLARSLATGLAANKNRPLWACFYWSSRFQVSRTSLLWHLICLVLNISPFLLNKAFYPWCTFYYVKKMEYYRKREQTVFICLALTPNFEVGKDRLWCENVDSA